ncbi:MAG: RibD family protein [Anaerolineales bacterium]|nr:RibD family protein [Anaerolineales bacterium]
MDLASEIVERANEHFLCSQKPLVTLTYAQSLDGSITAWRGIPLAISGAESYVLTHGLRGVHDCILVGIGTVLADNPRLTCRKENGRDPQPVVLDSQLRFPLDAAMLDNTLKPWIFTTDHIDQEKRKLLEDMGARVIPLEADAHGRVSLEALLDCLGSMGVKSVMVEGGARIITNFLSHRLADQLVLTVAPIFVGGLQAFESRQLLEQTDPPDPNKFLRLADMKFAQYGDDLVLWGQLAPECV